MSFELNDVLRSALNNISEGVYILDSNMIVRYINKSFYDIFEINPGEKLTGKFCHDASNGLLCAKTGSLCEAIKNGKEFNNIDFTFESPSSKKKIIRHSTKVVYNENNDLIAGIGIYKDISEPFTLRKQIKDNTPFHNIFGKNYKLINIFDSISQVSPTNATVLILGETGTGKELVANAVHKCSNREKGPFIKVNCSALSENILESELFGHVKGSFTGAIRDKIGKFELANKGTIFLDEIGELNKNIQIKLLRVLQEREIEKVGDNKTIKIDARIIAATNKDLKKEVKAERFREDLYFRLNVFPIILPPLRERADDIELLAERFLEKYNQIHDKALSFTPSIIPGLKRYQWPGNVRELEHVIEYAVIRSRGKSISVMDLPEDVKDTVELFSAKPENNGSINNDITKDVVLRILEASGWNKSKAAKSLALGRTTLWRLMKKYNIEDPSKEF